jgi:outer membrane protein TolC
MRVAGITLVACAVAGCSPAHYRQSADAEVYPIVGDRAWAAGFASDRFELEAHPTSRLADPTDPDHPPRPPDDPVAAVYMARPGGMKGAKWPNEQIDWIEPPGWEAGLPVGPDGVLKLDADRAFELALLHSRDYQLALERLYLAALALTLNRFEFQTQWFLRNVTEFSSLAPGTPGELNAVTSDTNFGFSKAFAAGGQLVVDFANNFIVEYTGNNRTAVSSTFVANFVQPLLRGAGRRVRLEQLTQAERDVLYAARDFYRFRKQFWAGVTTLSGGYLDQLLQVQTIRNAEENLRGQEQNLRLHEELFRGGKISIVQLDQVFQAYQQARAGVAQASAGRQTSLDEFKILLGLPPRIPTELDDTPLEPFVLVTPVLEALRVDIESYQRARQRDLDVAPGQVELRAQYREFDALANRVGPFIEAVIAELEAWGQTLDPARADESAVRARSTYEQFREALPPVRGDLEKIKADARTGAKDLAEEPAPGGWAVLVGSLGQVEYQRLEEARRRRGWEALVAVTRRLLTLTEQLIAVQTQVRINTIQLPAVEWNEPAAVSFAKANRLDLMTGQAQVTDAWRRVLVAANALKSELNLVANANLGTGTIGRSGGVDFVSDLSRYSVGLQFDGPLNRMAERNAYRAALIEYQQARRDYMLLSDRVEQAIRRDLRLLDLERLNFEISRLTLVSAARQLEAARQRLLQVQGGGRDEGTTRTIDLLNAQNSLLTARNGLVSGYITYEQLRVQLLLDLEALRLDPHGYPIDERRPLPADFAGDRCLRPEPGPAQPAVSGGPAELPPPRDGPPARLAQPR